MHVESLRKYKVFTWEGRLKRGTQRRLEGLFVSVRHLYRQRTNKGFGFPDNLGFLYIDSN